LQFAKSYSGTIANPKLEAYKGIAKSCAFLVLTWLNIITFCKEY